MLRQKVIQSAISSMSFLFLRYVIDDDNVRTDKLLEGELALFLNAIEEEEQMNEELIEFFQDCVYREIIEGVYLDKYLNADDLKKDITESIHELLLVKKSYSEKIFIEAVNRAYK